MIMQSRKRKKVEDDNQNPLRYRIGDYLAVRNEENGFYLCKTVCQNVYEKTRKWRVYWMDEVKDRPGFYRFEFVQWLHGDYSCVICHVKMNKVKDEKKIYELPADQRRKIDAILNAAISGKPLKGYAEYMDADAIMNGEGLEATKDEDPTEGKNQPDSEETMDGKAAEEEPSKGWFFGDAEEKPDEAGTAEENKDKFLQENENTMADSKMGDKGGGFASKDDILVNLRQNFLKRRTWENAPARENNKLDAPISKNAKSSGSKKKLEVEGAGPMKAQQLLDECTEPLIGMQFITEFTKNNPKVEARYVCNLCEGKCDPRTLISHITGVKHRMAYIKECFMNYHTILRQTQPSKKDQPGIIEDFARQIEAEEGRKPMKTKVEIDPFYNPNQEPEMKQAQKILQGHVKPDAAVGKPPAAKGARLSADSRVMKAPAPPRGRDPYEDVLPPTRGRRSDPYDDLGGRDPYSRPGRDRDPYGAPRGRGRSDPYDDLPPPRRGRDPYDDFGRLDAFDILRNRGKGGAGAGDFGRREAPLEPGMDREDGIRDELRRRFNLPPGRERDPYDDRVRDDPYRRDDPPRRDDRFRDDPYRDGARRDPFADRADPFGGVRGRREFDLPLGPRLDHDRDSGRRTSPPRDYDMRQAAGRPKPPRDMPLFDAYSSRPFDDDPYDDRPGGPGWSDPPTDRPAYGDRPQGAGSNQPGAGPSEQEACHAAITAKKAKREKQKVALEEEKGEKRKQLAMQKSVSNNAMVNAIETDSWGD